MNLREPIRLLLVASGTVACILAVVVALCLALFRTSPGVVKFHSVLYRGEPTNVACVVWGDGVWLHPRPNDWSSAPKEGDVVSVWQGPGAPKTGILRTPGSVWRAWCWAVGFGASGIALVAGGLFLVRYKPSPHEPKIAELA